MRPFTLTGERPPYSLDDLCRDWGGAAIVHMDEVLAKSTGEHALTRCVGPAGKYDGTPLLEARICREASNPLVWGAGPGHNDRCGCYVWRPDVRDADHPVGTWLARDPRPI